MVTVFSSIVNGRTKTSSCFHFFMFLTIQCQVVFALLSMVVAISEEGDSGSKRNISMVAPVALWNNKRAGITLVLLKNKLASAEIGRASCRERVHIRQVALAYTRQRNNVDRSE